MKVYYLLLILFLFGCKKSFLMDPYFIKNKESTPIVNSLFTNDSTFKVFTYLARSVFDEDTSTILNTIDAYIIDQNNDTIKLFQKSEHLYESEIVAKIGKEYKLFVETEQFGILKSQNSIPSDTIEIDSSNSNITFGKYRYNNESKIQIEFEDKSNKNAYYEVRVLLQSSLSYIYISADIDSYNYSDRLIFNLNNQGNKKNIYFLTPLKNNNNKNNVLITIKKISPDYYFYYKSFEYYQNTGNQSYFNTLMTMGFAPNEKKCYTNIDNGLGIFAGYNDVASITITF